jgi:hypothetical protein
MHSIQGNILTPDGWIQGDIAFGDTITQAPTATTTSCPASSTCTCTAAPGAT